MELSTNKISKKKKYLILALIPFFILMAFKDKSIGADTSAYMRMYDVVGTFNNLDTLRFDDTINVEIGYKYLTFFLSRCFNDAQILLYLSGSLVCISLFFFITKTARNYCLALFFFVTLGFFQFAMSGIRQTIAISIVLFGYEFIKRRKLIKFILIVALAMSFHKSALIVLPAYFLANIKLSAKNTALLITGMFILLFVADNLLLSVADIMEYNYGIEETGNGYIFFAIVLSITILCLSNKTLILHQNTANSILLNINFISMALWCVRLISRTAERVSLYFMPYTYVALEEIITSRKDADRWLYILASVLLAGFLCIYRLSRQPEFNDFKFFFQV